MPKLSVWMIRTALLHLGLGFALGALALWNKGLPISGDLWRLVGAHLDVLLIGWTAQLAMGTAFWILPRFSTTEAYTRGHMASRFGNVRLAWFAYVLVNIGVVAAVTGAIGNWTGWIVLGRVCQLLAVVSFAIHAWPRVRPVIID
jgi:hypothetical protein